MNTIKRFGAALLCVLALATLAQAQSADIPNGDTRALFNTLVGGRPFGQESLRAVAPILAQYCIALTPPNAVGDQTKIGDPVIRRWVRVGFGEGQWVWVIQGDAYEPVCETVRLPPSLDHPPVVVPQPVAVVPPQADAIAALSQRIDALVAAQAQLLALETDTNAKTTEIRDTSRTFAQQLGSIGKFAVKYIAPAVTAYLIGKKAA